MNSFLFRVAKNFISVHGSEIGQFSFVFPNRRAGLFFQRYIAELSAKPLFSPEIITINDCFMSASNWQLADRLGNLFKIYSIYRDISGSDESFDSFVYWGEMLLSDFDDVDKYLVDAKQLFSNVTDLKEIDRIFNVFSESQIAAIKQFWSNFSPVEEGKSKEDFIATWKVLYPVYELFRTQLIDAGLATEGMISRDVAERLKRKDDFPCWENKQFVFVGFNALNPCESVLMSELLKRDQADFYWDYEASELSDKDNPASLFFAQNTHLFPSKYPIEIDNEDRLDREIELIAVPSDVGQAKQAYHILNELYPSEKAESNWIKTAVVLPDENLLIPLLHSLPEKIAKINVTMGFPLKATPVSGLIDHIFELQRKARTSNQKLSFYHLNVSNILNHQYIELLCPKEVKALGLQMSQNNMIYVDASILQQNEILSSIFIPQNDVHSFLPYLLNILKALLNGWQNASSESNSFKLECDFIYQYYITLNRMKDVIVETGQDTEMGADTLMRLIKQITSGISIPFLGEPLDGLQIMGVLETRGLDFENLIISSFNEGVFPKKSQSNSFVPYNLRKGFNLPTYEHQDAITSYNFYRLIHRAKRIFFIYDSRTEGMKTGEVSRFIHQLFYQYNVNIKRKTVSYDIGFPDSKQITIEKTPDVMEKLLRFTLTDEKAKALSASSIKDYIDCPLQFYLTRIEEVQQPDEVKEVIEDSMFGNLFHMVMENIYEPFKGNILQPDDFDMLIKNSLNIDRQIRAAFAEKYFKRKFDDKIKLEGNNLLIASIIKKYVVQVLKTDKLHAPFRYIESEKRCHIRFPVDIGEVNIKGFIDRIDEKEGKIRILDYKTGGGNLEFKSWDEVFEHNNDKRPKYVLQTFLYGLLYKNDAQGKVMVPGVYYMRNVFKDGFVTELNYKPDKNTNIEIDDFSRFEEEFSERLTACINEIFDPNTPFEQTTSTTPCKYCAYKSVCNR